MIKEIHYKNQIARERGKRLKLCRTLADRTLQQLSSAHNISISCLAKWESGDLSITERNVQKITNLLLVEGVLCSAEWLLYGRGLPPSVGEGFVFAPREYPTAQPPLPYSQLGIFSEIEFFKKNNSKAVIKAVHDDSMHPVFSKGDFVGGIEIPPQKYEDAKGDYCIVESANGKLVIGQLFIQENKVTLMAPGRGNHKNPLCMEPHPRRVCPIIFHRKPFRYTDYSQASLGNLRAG